MADLYGTTRPLSTVGGSALSPVLQERMAAAEMNKVHKDLQKALKDLKEDIIHNILQSILAINCALKLKCKHIKVFHVFHHALQINNELQKIVTCLNIITKYGQNLLKPNIQRHPSWRLLPFHNITFQSKVDSVDGARDVLKDLGYTMETSEGLMFPSNLDPDVDRIAVITSDVLILHNEFHTYLQQQHPYALNVDCLLPTYQIKPQFEIAVSSPSAQDASVSEVIRTTTSTDVEKDTEDDDEEFHDAKDEVEEEALNTTVCDICGCKPHVFVCDSCDGKQLCQDCDNTWHRHPRRKSHHRNRVSTCSTSLPLENMQQLDINSNTGAKPKILPKPFIKAHSDNQKFTPKIGFKVENIETSICDNLPILSIFNQENFVSSRGCKEEALTTVEKTNSGSIARLSNPQAQSVPASLLDEIKSISDIDARLVRIKSEMGSIDVKLDQYKQEINVIFRRDEHYEKNDEYIRLSRQRDRLNRDKILIEEHWKELEKQKFEAKQNIVETEEKIDLAPSTVNSEVVIRYPPNVHSESILLPPDGNSSSYNSKGARPKSIGLLTDNYLKKSENFNLNQSKTLPSKLKIGFVERREPSAWICDHCTFHNKLEDKSCAICRKASTNPSRVYDNIREETILQDNDDCGTSLQEQYRTTKHGYIIGDSDNENFDVLIQEKEQYFKRNATEGCNAMFSINESGDNLNATSSTTTNKRRPAFLDTKSKYEYPQQLQEIEEIKWQSKEIIRNLREAELKSYNINEVEFAIKHCNNVDPFIWLNSQFPALIDTTVKEASRLLSESQDCPVSVVEAKEAFMECEGDVSLAANVLITKRQSMLQDLLQIVHSTPERVIQVLENYQYDRKESERALISDVCEKFTSKFWANENEFPLSIPDELPGVNTLTHEQTIEQHLRNRELDFEWKTRMVLSEFSTKIASWGRAEVVVKLLTEELDENISLDEVLEAVRQCGNRRDTLLFLQQECVMCYSNFPASKILSLTTCQCKVCQECMRDYFEVQIRTKHVKNLVCPHCQLPDLDNLDTEHYLTYLANFLKNMSTIEVYDLFEHKITEWNLHKDPNFRWCSTENCENGFIFNVEGRRLKMRCNKCGKFTCFQCRKPWEDQHEGLTCEQFQKWKEDNNPEFQERGLAQHLQENGIDCPQCKFRYALAKGGCMHFKCTQCGHDFCCGCNKPFMQGDACKVLQGCSKAGLHCHHPRDCLYYLRDLDIALLQQMLTDVGVDFKQENPKESVTCVVLEQKETQDGFKDEPCNKPIEANQGGLCATHYKEYLVSIINRNEIDPVVVMNINELTLQYLRRDNQAPVQLQSETETQYKQRLINDVKQQFPLEKRNIMA